jgi:hypothetical protein
VRQGPDVCDDTSDRGKGTHDIDHSYGDR